MATEKSRLDRVGYFLWGYLKEKVYAIKLHDLYTLEAAIREECARVPNDMLQQSVSNVGPRLQRCATNAGAYVAI